MARPTPIRPIMKTRILAKLRYLATLNGGDTEANHSEADKALLTLIDDPEISEAYEAIDRWYA